MKSIVGKISGIIMVLMLATACTRIAPGHVGIKVNMYGSDKGVDSYPAVTGMQFYMPLTTSIFEYPVYVQTTQWTKDSGDDDLSEEVVFNDKDGLAIGTDISLSWQLNGALAPAFYVKFRSDDLAQFTHGFMRNVARDSFNEVAVKYSAEDIYGAKKEEFLQKVRDRVNAEVKHFGVEIQQLGVVGAMRLPPQVVEALNNKIKATQIAQQKENELRATQAEMAKRVAEAEGEAKATIAAAEGTSRANGIITASLNERLVEWRKLDIQQMQIQRWNGQMPSTVVSSGANMLLGVK